MESGLASLSLDKIYWEFVLFELQASSSNVQFLSLFNAGCIQDGGIYAKASNVLLVL